MSRPNMKKVVFACIFLLLLLLPFFEIAEAACSCRNSVELTVLGLHPGQAYEVCKSTLPKNCVMSDCDLNNSTCPLLCELQMVQFTFRVTGQKSTCWGFCTGGKFAECAPPFPTLSPQLNASIDISMGQSLPSSSPTPSAFQREDNSIGNGTSSVPTAVPLDTSNTLTGVEEEVFPSSSPQVSTENNRNINISVPTVVPLNTLEPLIGLEEEVFPSFSPEVLPSPEDDGGENAIIEEAFPSTSLEALVIAS